MINNSKYKILPEDYILVEYELFFNDDFNIYNRFSIDEDEEIKYLQKILKKVSSIDENAVIYVLSYSDISIDYKGTRHIYADSIWIDSQIDNDCIDQMFSEYKMIEPSQIFGFYELEEYNQSHFYLFKMEGEIIDLKKDVKKYNFDNVKILYWD